MRGWEGVGLMWVGGGGRYRGRNFEGCWWL